jgi:hypothetical protein
VLLATLGVPLDAEAASLALDAAVESGSRFIVANVTTLEPLRMSVTLGYDALAELTPEVSSSIGRSVELAVSLGVPVERLRVRSPRPVTALLELAAECRPGLLVFGADRRALGSRRYARVVRALRAQARCLLWTAEIGE